MQTHWQTPKDLYNKLNNEFKFNYDACPLLSTKNTLYEEWGSSTFCNPPYDKKNKEKFIKKAYLESLKNKTIILLIPVSTSSKIFHEIILPKAEIRFIKGRIKFIDAINNKKKWPARHDSMIIIFKPT